MKNPHFHFLVKTYNFSNYIIQYLESVRFQISNYSRDYYIEITIIDDCSTDDTLEVVNEWMSEKSSVFNKVTVKCNEKNLGIIQTQIIALNSINSDFFHIMDGDDFYNYFNIFEFIANADKYDFYFTPTIRFDYLDFKTTNFFKSFLPFFYFYTSKKKSEILLNLNPLPNPGSRISRKVLNFRLESYNISDIAKSHLAGGDLLSWMDAFRNESISKGFGFLPYVLYRVGSGISTNKATSQKSFVIDIPDLGFGIIKYDKDFLEAIIYRSVMKLKQITRFIVSFLTGKLPYSIFFLIKINKRSKNHLLDIVKR